LENVGNKRYTSGCPPENGNKIIVLSLKYWGQSTRTSVLCSYICYITARLGQIVVLLCTHS